MARIKCGQVVAGAGVLGAMGVIAVKYLFNPWADRWGATLAEVYASLPGDEIIPHPKGQSTHAITIDAPAARIWPWLAQIGQGRGGFYSYDWLENLFGLDIHSADHIIPQFQTLSVGDMVRMQPEGGMQVAFLEPERALVFYTDSDTIAGRPSRMTGELSADPLDFVSTWGFYLRPLDERTTRLIARSRGDWASNVQAALAWDFLMTPISFIMSQKMLRGIKERVEAT